MLRLFLPCLLAVTAIVRGEEWAWLDNGRVRLGVNLDAGGCVGWFSPSRSDANLLNTHDEGRYLQQSYYGDPDGSDWNGKPWRFNPVQGGSWKGKRSTVLERRIDKDRIYIKTRPRHWATGRDIHDVTMEQWLVLDGDLARLRFRMSCGDGVRPHQPAHQELPALFVHPRYDTLVFCEAAQRPWRNALLTARRPGFPNERVKFSEPWCAWVDKDGRGIGLYFPHAREATTYRYRDGGVSDCSYIAPIQIFALKPGRVFEYDVALAIGTAEQVRAAFRRLAESGGQK